MKKAVSLAILTVMLLSIFCSCGQVSGKISYVRVGDLLSYKTLYLYKFKDAEIDSIYESTTSTETPTSSGYVYSTEKLEVGDEIKVWSDFKFGEKGTGFTDTRKSGTMATVEKIVETFRVKVSANGDTYIITYYEVQHSSTSGSSVSDKDNIKNVEKHKIQVTKDRVIIVYETEYISP